MLGLTHKHHACLAFSLGSNDPESGFRVRTGSVPSTEPSPSPNSLYEPTPGPQGTCVNGCVDRRETACPSSVSSAVVGLPLMAKRRCLLNAGFEAFIVIIFWLQGVFLIGCFGLIWS